MPSKPVKSGSNEKVLKKKMSSVIVLEVLDTYHQRAHDDFKWHPKNPF